MDVFLVRHAQTEWNVARRLQGQLDSAVTPGGLLQTAALAERLAQTAVTRVVTSPLGRCVRTAEVLCQHLGLAPPVSEPRWAEHHLGRLQGKAIATLEGEDLQQYESWKRGSPDYRVEGGETRREVLQRSLATLHELADAQDVPALCVVTHGGVLSVLLRRLLGVPLETPRYFAIDNCSVHQLRFERGSFIIKTLGDVSHLR